MNDVYDLLVELKNLGARIYSVDDKIKLDIEPDVLSSKISDKIKYYRKDILLLLQESYKKNDFVEIEKLPSQESYALSDGQRRFWILSQFKGGSSAYRISGNLYLDSKVNVEIVKKSLWSVLERHESLRTVYKLDDSGELRQCILSVENSGFNIDYQDFRNEQNKIESMESYLGKISREEFDLENGPLFKVSLIRLENDDYVGYYDVHHINADGWSMAVFFNDLNKFYDAYQAGQAPDIPPLKFQYKDYAAWQLKMLADESSNSHRAYWLEHLKGELPRLDLPNYKPRPKELTYSGEAYKSSFIGARTITSLKEYSEKNGGSLFIGLFAVWNVLMYRYTSIEDIIIGTPLNGREHADTIDQIGLYMNTLTIRNKLSPEENFNSIFNKVRQNMLNAYSHQVYPFNRLVDELSLPKDASRNTVFDIMLVYNSAGKESNSSSGNDQSGQTIQIGNTTSRFDLEVGFKEIDNYIQVWGVYNPDVYEAEMIENLITHYKRLLDELVENTEKKISTINFLSEEERNKLLVSYNDTTIAYGKKTIKELFEEQVEKSPEKPALIFEDRTLTYQELNARSNVVANCLIKEHNVSKTSKVGVLLDRSMESVISMLAVIKSGACYFSIDPNYPTDRVAYIVEDSGADIIISTEQLSGKHGLAAYRILDLAKIDFKIFETSNPSQTNNFADACFIIYTSGSTGTPKGVVQTHRMMSNLVQWDVSDSGLERGLKHLQYISFSFDVHLQDCWSTLCGGGALYLTPESIRLDFLSLWNFIKEQGIEVLSFPYSAFRLLIEQNSHLNFSAPKLKHVICSGEQLIINPGIQKFFETNRQLCLHNHYGPSETHVVTSYTMKSLLGIDVASNILIGRPISNTQIYILDSSLNLVAQGVKGEIYIGGDGLAQGYLNQEEITAEKFIVSPFKEGESLYKTGDLGRWLPDGNIEFIGRNDDQVKINGYRIELGEIEHVFSRIAGIKASCVVVKEKVTETGSTKYLVGYYMADESAALSPEDIFIQISKVLPNYMLPSSLIAMESFPLTVNGKLDKRALPDPDFSSSDKYVAPVTETEVALCKIWQEVLGLEHVGVRDNFFRIGGNSINAIQISHRISKKLGVEFTIKDIFICPTITSIIDMFEVKSYPSGILTRKPLNTHSSTSNIGENLYYTLPLQSARYQSYKSGKLVRLNSLIIKELNNVDEKMLSMTLDTMVSRHESLRTVFLERGEMVVQKICNEDTFIPTLLIEDIREQENKDEKIKWIVNDLSTYTFDFEKEPSFKCKLIKYREDKYLLIFVIDHIIYDAHSLKLIEKELLMIYDAYSKGLPNPLEPLNEQLKDFANFYRKHYEGEKLIYHKAYFENLAKDASERPKIRSIDNVDKNAFKAERVGETQNPSSLEYSDGGRYRFVIPEDILQKIQLLSSEMKISFFNFMLASYSIFLNRVTFQKDFIIDSPMSTRSKEDHSGIIGWLTGTLVTRIKVDENANFRDMLKVCSKAFVDAVDHIYYQSYDHVLNPDRFQVAQLNVLNDINNAEGNIVDFQPYDSDWDNVYFNINFLVEAFKNGLLITCSYRRNFIDKRQISDICGKFLEVLNVATNSPDVKIRDWSNQEIRWRLNNCIKI
jgi:amino acid adenylation domain-containing protein